MIDIYNGYKDACIEIDEQRLGRFYDEYEELYAEAKSVVDYWLGSQDDVIITRIIDKIYATDDHDDVLFAEILTILTGTKYEYDYFSSYGEGLGILYPVKWREDANMMKNGFDFTHHFVYDHFICLRVVIFYVILYINKEVKRYD